MISILTPVNRSTPIKVELPSNFLGDSSDSCQWWWVFICIFGEESQRLVRKETTRNDHGREKIPVSIVEKFRFHA